MQDWQISLLTAAALLLMQRGLDLLRDKRKRKETKEDKQADREEQKREKLADKNEQEKNEVLTAIREMQGEMKGMKQDISSFRTELKQVRDEAEEGRVLERRIRILRFADEITHGTRHSKDHFQQLMEDGKIYKAYCKDHEDFPNGVTEPAIKLIEDTYYERLQKNDFL